MAQDPWAFGWTQLLTIIGFLITVGIAAGGFRTFNRWKREQLEERRIEVAIELLTLAYRTKFVFEFIRSRISYGHEWADMPKREGETEDQRQRRGPYYAVLKRMDQQRDYFDQVWDILPKCMAIFGRNVEATFLKLLGVRHKIVVAAQMLSEEVMTRSADQDDVNRRLYEQLRRELWWDVREQVQGTDEVSRMLREFEDELEAIAKPVLDREYVKLARRSSSTAT